MSLDYINPIFSVVVTTYNYKDYIMETLQSIDRQSFEAFEVIIIEDCSSDITPNIIKRYIQDKPYWTMYNNERNMGVGYSRNRGFTLASGQYIAIIDGDDIWMKDKLLLQYHELRRIEADFCYSSYSIINHRSEDISFTYRTRLKAQYNTLLKENYIGCSTAVFSTKIISQVKMKENILNEDFCFWLQILKLGYTGIGIRESLVQYRLHENSRSYNKLKVAKNRFEIYRKVEKMSILVSVYSFIIYAVKAAIKYAIISVKLHFNGKRPK